MNGAQALIRTLVNGGIRVCFTNPGTSEMHFVAALDSVPEMRGVLALFEGVATGAADGYARMTGTPAATLLHLGSGLGNGVANLHNARRAGVPLVNIVGDHATYHKQYDAPLQSDIETIARNVSPGWVRTAEAPQDIGRDASEAISAAVGPPGQVATLILPADVSWSDGAEAVSPQPSRRPQRVADGAIADAAGALQGSGKTAILLGGQALRRGSLMSAARIAAASGARLLAEVFPTRLERGAGLPLIERLAYVPELAAVQLRGISRLILVDAQAPVTFFAYPGMSSELVPDGCQVLELAGPADDAAGALEALAERLAATAAAPAGDRGQLPTPPKGQLTADAVCQAVGATLPEGAIISDEAQTSGVMLASATAEAPAHDLLALTGGAIGQGLPVAVGAAVACPDRPVLALDGDGSAMYTIQSLWTMAREGLNVTAIILNNRSYGILNLELERVGAKGAGPKAKSQLDLGGTNLDFVALGQGMGVASARVETAEGLVTELKRAYSEPGPHLIEAVIPPAYTPWQLKAMPRALGALTRLPRPVANAVKRRVYP